MNPSAGGRKGITNMDPDKVYFYERIIISALALFWGIIYFVVYRVLRRMQPTLPDQYFYVDPTPARMADRNIINDPDDDDGDFVEYEEIASPPPVEKAIPTRDRRGRVWYNATIKERGDPMN